MGFELQHTSQINFDGTPLDCVVYNTVFGSCKPINRMMNDLFTGVCTLLNASLGDMNNVGGGSEWYVDLTSSPYEFRSIITNPGLDLINTGNELRLQNNFISNNNSMLFSNSGSALDVKTTGGDSFINIGTGTGEIYFIFMAGFFQMRRIRFGYYLISDIAVDKGFVKTTTVSNDVIIQERKGGYATVDFTYDSSKIDIGVWVPILAATPANVNEPITVNKCITRHCLSDNIMLINFDIDIEFELDYVFPLDGSMLIGLSMTSFYDDLTGGLTATNLGFSSPFGGGGQVNYKKITQNLVFYDLGIGVNKDNVDDITERYSKKKFCEAKLTNAIPQIGQDYDWPQLNGSFDQLLFNMIPVSQSNKNLVHRFVSRGTIMYAVYPRSLDNTTSIADLYDETINIEKNF